MASAIKKWAAKKTPVKMPESSSSQFPASGNPVGPMAAKIRIADSASDHARMLQQRAWAIGQRRPGAVDAFENAAAAYEVAGDAYEEAGLGGPGDAADVMRNNAKHLREMARGAEGIISEEAKRAKVPK